jgi:hypothetical protein
VALERAGAEAGCRAILVAGASFGLGGGARASAVNDVQQQSPACATTLSSCIFPALAYLISLTAACSIVHEKTDGREDCQHQYRQRKREAIRDREARESWSDSRTILKRQRRPTRSARNTGVASLSPNVAQTRRRYSKMVRLARKTQILALLALAGTPVVIAQDSNLPDLDGSTSEEPTSTTASSTKESTSSSSGSSATSTDASTTDSSSATSAASTTSTGSSSSGASSTVNAGPTDLPTIAGAGIPTMVVPYTANAPFMQHSTLPQGTVFIVVGAVLAFLGACVLFWRALVAWSINRSVKQAAIASVSGNDKATKTWGGSSAGYNPVKGNLYKDAGSNMSLEALNAAGKPLKTDTSRKQPPPDGLFFSPTAHNRMSDAGLGTRPVSQLMGNRSSTYLPAGYYANTSVQPGGGAGSTTIGGNLAPYARNSVYENSPPTTPGHTGNSRNSYLRASSRDGLGGSRNSYLDPSPRAGHSSASYNTQPQNNDGLPGSRAPSAYLEDLFDNHGAGPRERF